MSRSDLRARRLQRIGVLLVLVAGAGFGANGVFAKLSFQAGVSVGTFLTIRFCLAALIFWLVLRPRFSRRETVPGLALGLAYCGQAAFYFAAVAMQDVATSSLFQSITPALVALGAVLIGREPARPRVFLAAAAAVIGAAFVALFGDGEVGKIVPLGVVLATASAAWYAAYLLVGDRIVASADPLRLACLIATGAAISFLTGSSLTGQLHITFQPIGWLWLLASAVVSTCLAVTAMMAGMKRIGPSTTGVLTTFEPVATIVYAALLFGERLTFLQSCGAGLVLLAVIIVQLPGRKPVRGPMSEA